MGLSHSPLGEEANQGGIYELTQELTTRLKQEYLRILKLSVIMKPDLKKCLCLV